MSLSLQLLSLSHHARLKHTHADRQTDRQTDGDRKSKRNAMASDEGGGKLLERYRLSPAGLHVTPAKRTARSQAESAGRGAGKFLRPGRAAASASGSGEQAQFRSSHLRHHTLYPSEVSVALPATLAFCFGL